MTRNRHIFTQGVLSRECSFSNQELWQMLYCGPFSWEILSAIFTRMIPAFEAGVCTRCREVKRSDLQVNDPAGFVHAGPVFSGVLDKNKNRPH